MQTIGKKIDCIGSRKSCRYWKNGRKKKTWEPLPQTLLTA